MKSHYVVVLLIALLVVFIIFKESGKESYVDPSDDDDDPSCDVNTFNNMDVDPRSDVNTFNKMVRELIKELIDVVPLIDAPSMSDMIMKYSWVPIIVQMTISTKPLDINKKVATGAIYFTHEFGIQKFIRIAPKIYHILESGAISIKVYEEGTNRIFFTSRWGFGDRAAIMDMIIRINDWYQKNYKLDINQQQQQRQKSIMEELEELDELHKRERERLQNILTREGITLTIDEIVDHLATRERPWRDNPV